MAGSGPDSVIGIDPYNLCPGVGGGVDDDPPPLFVYQFSDLRILRICRVQDFVLHNNFGPFPQKLGPRPAPMYSTENPKYLSYY